MSATRLDANIAILELLQEAIERYPDQRFGQLLLNLGVFQQEVQDGPNDPFSEESTVTLRRMKRAIRHLEGDATITP